MFILEISPIFRPFLEAALVRFGYLYPDIAVRPTDTAVEIDAEEASAITALRREFLHLLYREKIYSETLSIRTRMFETLTNG